MERGSGMAGRRVGGVLCALLSVALPVAAQVPEWQPRAVAAKALPAPWSALPAGSVTPMAQVAAKAGEGWTLHLPDGTRFAVEGASEVRHPNGDRSFAGTVAGAGALYGVLLTVGEEASFGSFDTPAGRWRLEARGSEGWLLDVQHAGLRLEAADGHALQPPAGAAGRVSRVVPGDKAAAATTIDVLFLYDADFASRYPGTAAQTRINHLVAVANQAFADSGVSLALRLRAADQTPYIGPSGDNGVALQQMAETLDGQSSAFPGLQARRAALGADLVTLVRPHDIETRGSCGIAYFPNGNAAYGVNVLSDSFSGWSLCSDDVYAHEVGHNLGAEHQDGANSPNAGFGTPWIRPGRLHTVMGSFGSGHPDRYLGLARFSNPQQQCGGAPCGVANVHDNARRLRETMATVAAYQPSTSSVPGEAPPARDPDVDGDGVAESADAFPHDARWHADRDGDGVADPVDAFPDDPTESLDSDGDGIGNLADTDDDGDGVADGLDALPLDPGESQDSDGDGHGDVADAFPQDRREWRDSDGDGLGDHAETDADGDGVADVVAGTTAAAQDLLVVSSGTDRILRFDADGGLWAGVDVADRHVPQALGRQAALAWNPFRRELLALVGGSVRRYDRSGPAPLGVFLQPNALGPRPALPSAFPAGLAVTADGTVIVADEGARVLSRHDAVTGHPLPGGVFMQPDLFAAPVRDAALAAGSVWVLESSGRISQVDVASGALLQAATVPQGSFGPDGAGALAVSPDGAQLFLADPANHRVLTSSTASPAFTRVLVGSGSGGLQHPAGLALGPDGRLYVSSLGTDQVLRFDAGSGAFQDVFTQAPAGVLSQPRDLAFVPRVGDRHPRDPARTLRPVAGGWYNPARSGHGLDVQQVGGQLSVIWYTFESDGTPVWYLAVAPLQGSHWQGELRRFRWDASSRSASSEVVGSATLDFSGERRAEFGWTLDGTAGSEPMEPLAVGRSSETQFPTAAWYPPQESGWGLSVTRQGEVAYAIAFVYDAQGEPSWLTASAAADPQRMAMAALRFHGPTRCPGCPGEEAAEAVPAGELVFTIVNGEQAGTTLDLQTGDGRWQRTDVSLERLTDTPTRAGGDPY